MTATYRGPNGTFTAHRRHDAREAWVTDADGKKVYECFLFVDAIDKAMTLAGTE